MPVSTFATAGTTACVNVGTGVADTGGEMRTQSLKGRAPHQQKRQHAARLTWAAASTVVILNQETAVMRPVTVAANGLAVPIPLTLARIHGEVVV